MKTPQINISFQEFRRTEYFFPTLGCVFFLETRKCENSYVYSPFLGGEVFLFYSQTSHDSQSSHLPQIEKI